MTIRTMIQDKASSSVNRFHTKSEEGDVLEKNDMHQKKNDKMTPTTAASSVLENTSPTSVLAPVTTPLVIPEPLDLVKTSSAGTSHSCITTLSTTESSCRWKNVIVAPSLKSLRTHNPIRAIVDPILIQQQTNQKHAVDFISLALGDPTGYFPSCPGLQNALIAGMMETTNAAPYINACGTIAARRCIASTTSRAGVAVTHDTTTNATTTTAAATTAATDHYDHVVIASGCSGALELVLTSILNPDSEDVILIPRPGFPLYQVICEAHGVNQNCIMHYDLDPDCNWQVDLTKLQQQLRKNNNNNKKKIKAMIVNNPSNPTGAVYSETHLQDIVQFCSNHEIVIIADEVYGDLVFSGHEYIPLARVAAKQHHQHLNVPVITVSGLGKQYLLPGWRVGWVIFHDNMYGSLKEVEAAVKRLAQLTLGASHLPQTVVPYLLDPHNQAVCQWKQQVRQAMEQRANFLFEQLQDCIGLSTTPACGAMYLMARIDVDRFDDSIKNDIDFSSRLIEEENVLVLPGSCFGMEHAVRLVFCAPLPILQEAAHRIKEFCRRHVQNSNNNEEK